MGLAQLKLFYKLAFDNLLQQLLVRKLLNAREKLSRFGSLLPFSPMGPTCHGGGEISPLSSCQTRRSQSASSEESSGRGSLVQWILAEGISAQAL